MSDTSAAPPMFAPAPEIGAGLRAARRTETGGILSRRWAGCWIDFLAGGVAFLIPFLLYGMVGGSAEDLPTGLVLVSLVMPLAYYIVTEGLWGRTLGKVLTGTIVVDASGRKPGFGRVTVRTLARLLEVNPFLLGGLPAGLVAAFTQNHQRLGDLLAKIYVVPVKLLGEALTTPVRPDQDVFD